MGISDVIDGLTRQNAKYWNPPSWWVMFITLPWVVGMVFGLWGFASGQRIAGRQQTTVGFVRAHEPQNHNRYGYEYSVGGRVLNGWQIPSTEYEIGQVVVVYYDPLDPSTSALESFADGEDQNLGLAWCCAGGIALFAFAVFALRRSHARRSSATA